MTENELDEYLSFKIKLEMRVDDIRRGMIEVCKEVGESTESLEYALEITEIDSDFISMSGDECYGGNVEYHGFEFPSSYLYTDDLIWKAEIREKLIKKQEQREIVAQDKSASRKKYELELLARLQKKYSNIK